MTTAARLSLVVSALLVLAAWSFSARAHGSHGSQPITHAELVLQPGHTLGASEYAVTPDGQLMVTAGGTLDKTARIWDLASSRQLRAFGSSVAVRHVAISPDGRRVALPSATDEVTICAVDDGSVLKRVHLSAASVSSLAFSPDGETLAVGSTGALDENRWLRLLDVETGTQSELSRRQPVWQVSFAPDGRLFWIEGTALRLAEKPWTAPRVMASFGGMASSLSMSGDGRLLAAAYYTGRDTDTEVAIWDARSAERLWVSDTPRSDRLVVSFNADGTRLATAGHLSDVIVYSAPAWTPGAPIPGRQPAFLSDGRLALSKREGIVVTDPGGAAPVVLDDRTGASVKAARFSGDGRYVVAGSAGAVVLWDLQSGQPAQVWREQYRSVVDAVATSADGKWAVIPGVGPELRAVDLPAGTVRFTIDGKAGQDTLSHAGPLAVSRDDRWIADGVARYSPSRREFGVRVSEAATGRTVRILRGPPALVEDLALSRDGTLVAAIDGEGGLWLWERESGRRLFSNQVGVLQSGISFVKNQLVVAALNDLKVFDSRGLLVREIKDHPAFVHRLATSPDERLLAMTDDEENIVVWDAGSWTKRATLSGHQGAIEDVSFSPDGAWLLTASYDGTARLWDVRGDSMRQALVLATSRSSSDWVAVTPDGLFDGSPDGWDLILWRFSQRTRDVTPVEAFFTDYFHPGLIADVVRREVRAAPTDIAARDRRLPTAAVEVVSSDGTSARVRVTATEAEGKSGGGVRDVRLFRNGISVRTWRGAQPPSVRLETDVPLVDGANVLTAYAFNHDNVKSRNGRAVVKGTHAGPGRIFVIAAGVNVYEDSTLNLKNAVADARAFSETVSRDIAQATGKVPVVSLLPDDRASAANIRTALALLGGASAPSEILPEELRPLRKTTPADLVLFFFAGHATVSADRFFLLPHDVAAGTLRPSLTSDDLQELIERIDAGGILMIVDSCQSGQLLESDDPRQGPLNTKGLAQLAYDKGMYVLAASQSYQAAIETSRLGHGLLTHALVVDGLERLSADASPRDGQIDVREWFQYAVGRVPQLATDGASRLLKAGAGQKGPQVPRAFFRRDTPGDAIVIKRR